MRRKTKSRRWNRPTMMISWATLLVFTYASSALNVISAGLGGSSDTLNQVIHGGLPVTLLVALVLAEGIALSDTHAHARVISLLGLAVVAAVTFTASYIGIHQVFVAHNPNSADSLMWAAAIIPDVLMVVATVALVSLRQKSNSRDEDEKPAPKTPRMTRWSRLADAATARAEAVLTVPVVEPENAQVSSLTEAPPTSTEGSENLHGSSANSSVEDSGNLRGTSANPSAEGSENLRETSVEVSVKPPRKPARTSVEASAKPFLASAERMVAEGLVRGKTAVEIARIIAAIEDGATDNSIKQKGLGSAGTADKVRTAWTDQRSESRRLTPVG